MLELEKPIKPKLALRGSAIDTSGSYRILKGQAEVKENRSNLINPKSKPKYPYTTPGKSIFIPIWIDK